MSSRIFARISDMAWWVRALTAVLLLSAALVVSCGGGFSGDSRNARDLGEAIFGPSSPDSSDSE